MRQIAMPWAPDIQAELQTKWDKDEAFCEEWCEHYKYCIVKGKPYCGPDCQLEMDERNSR